MGLGLGIDAGGTYTDTVLFDFAGESVKSKGKALTTRDNYTKGITTSLDQLEIDSPQLIDLVGLSTTLATNALVEGKGARAGLLLIGYDPELVQRFLQVGPYWIVAGGHDMRGQEKSALDEGQVRRAVAAMSQDVEVIAISEMGGAVKPEHERRVQELVEREFKIPAIAGHEISSDMDSMKRATTVFWNARLIPVLLELIEAVKAVLNRRGINAPIMLVRSDGTMMGEELARRRPIETLMSGPVASIYGALYLTGCQDALVIDMGGTTTDIGLVKNGQPRLSSGGARIGVYRTTVKTLDLHTTGLGGDSEISITGDGRLAIGPRRVVPISLAAQHYQGIAEEIKNWKAIQNEYVDAGLLPPVEFFIPVTKNGVPPEGMDKGIAAQLATREQKILASLASLGGASRFALATTIDYRYPSLLPMDHLENLGLVQRVGLTPTDVLQALGRLDSWDGEAARLAVQAFSARLQDKAIDTGETVLGAIQQRLAEQMLNVLLTENTPGKSGQAARQASKRAAWGRCSEALAIETCPLCQYFVDMSLNRNDQKSVSCSIQIGIPLVAVGAPVSAYFPALAKSLHTELLIPEHADVANAIGAITGSINLAVEAVVAITGDERYIIQGVPENNSFDELDTACAAAVDYVTSKARERAKAAGAKEVHIEILQEELVSQVGQELGQAIFLETKITARASGRPEMRT